MQMEQAPLGIKEAVSNAEELLCIQMPQKYEFEVQLKEKKYDKILRLKEQDINHLEDKIKRQDHNKRAYRQSKSATQTSFKCI